MRVRTEAAEFSSSAWEKRARPAQVEYLFALDRTPLLLFPVDVVIGSVIAPRLHYVPGLQSLTKLHVQRVYCQAVLGVPQVTTLAILWCTHLRLTRFPVSRPPKHWARDTWPWWWSRLHSRRADERYQYYLLERWGCHPRPGSRRSRNTCYLPGPV